MDANIIAGYIEDNFSIHTVFIDGSTSNGSHGVINEQECTIQFSNCLRQGTHKIHKSMVSLAASMMFKDEDFPLDNIRSDVKHQVSIPDEIDWDHLLDTAARGKVRADFEKRNMTPDFEV